MNPPYTITTQIIQLIATVSIKIGALQAIYLAKATPKLRKQNQIKTIQSSLQIEGNTLTEEQITAIVENKRVIGSQKDIQEVVNALNVYDNLKSFKFDSSKDFLKAHKMLMENLILNPGKYRKQGVGIVKGTKVEHIAPPYENVPFLMEDLFEFLKDKTVLTLVKSCVFHYELEFIHPFLDGNGRMGRLWQTLILMHEFPVFEFLPFETLISKNQEEYYKVLSTCDKEGNSTKFIVYMLSIIEKSLDALLEQDIKPVDSLSRIQVFINQNEKTFTRKDYMMFFKNISSATASRDLFKGVEAGLIIKRGVNNKTEYYKK